MNHYDNNYVCPVIRECSWPISMLFFALPLFELYYESSRSTRLKFQTDNILTSSVAWFNFTSFSQLLKVVQSLVFNISRGALEFRSLAQILDQYEINFLTTSIYILDIFWTGSPHYQNSIDCFFCLFLVLHNTCASFFYSIFFLYYIRQDTQSQSNRTKAKVIEESMIVTYLYYLFRGVAGMTRLK